MTAFCLDCRTVVSDTHPRQPCAGGYGHRVTVLDDAAGRDRLVDEVWGPPHLRRRLKEAAVAGSSGSAGGLLLESTCSLADCGLVDCVAADTFGWLIGIGAIVGVLLWLGVKGVSSLWRRHRDRPRPKGAWVQPARPAGKVWAGAILPGGDDPGAALARGLRLECTRFIGTAVMLRDGFCEGLVVELEDGRRVRIPAGRLRVEGPTGLYEALTSAEVEAYLGDIDPLRKQPVLAAEPAAAQALDPIPCDRARQILLRAGDRVELYGNIDWGPDPDQPAGYRSAAASLGVPGSRAFMMQLVSHRP